jgi:PAS domain S-box-containing protein
MLPDRDGRVWVATTRRGLLGYRDGNVYSLSQLDLPGRAVSALTRDSAGNLWFGCGRAMVMAAGDAIWEAMLNTNRSLAYTVFGEADGLRPPDFSDNFQPSSVVDEIGQLWFPLARGAAAIRPRELVLRKRPPPLIVERLSYVPGGTNRPVVVDLTEARMLPVLPAGSRHIQFECALLDFFAPGEQRFSYRIGHVSQEWQTTGAENTFTFYELAAGDYSLYLKGIGSDRVSSPVVFQGFRIEEIFWKTDWFRWLTGVILVTLTGGVTWWVTERRNRFRRERAEANRRFAELQTRLTLVLENTSDFMAFVDTDGKLLYLNDAGCRMVGLPGPPDPGKQEASILYPSWVNEKMTKEWLPFARQHKVWSGESALQHRDGHLVPVSQVIIAHLDPFGKLDFSSTIIRDITAAKRDAVIRESLRELASALTAGLKPIDLGRTVALQCRKIFQHDAFFLALIDQTGSIYQNTYAEDRAASALAPEPVSLGFGRISPTLRRVLNGEQILINRIPNRPEDGTGLQPFGLLERRSESLLFAPIRWEGRCVGVVSVQSYTPQRYSESDLNLLQTFADQCGAAVARLEVEESLRANEERLRLAIEAANMGSWEVDFDLRRLVATEQAERIYGYPLGTMGPDPKRLTERIPPDEWENVSRKMTAFFDGRLESIECTHRIRMPDGTERWVEVKGRLHRGAGNKDVRALGITADITNRKQAELERARLESNLRHSQKMQALGTMAGGIAHDFNNILTGILGYTDLARMRLPKNHRAAECLAEVGKGANRAKQVVSQILTFSRRGEPQRNVMRLWPCVAEALRLLRSSLPATIEFKTGSATAENDYVMADPTQIHQVIMNLGTNAGHAMRERGGVLEVREDLVEMETEWDAQNGRMPPGRYVRLSVRDTGTGMAAETLERIFEPFFTTKGPGEGTGLGLAVVHGIVQSHEGAIQVSSRVGEGTVFRLFFPRVAPIPANPPASKQTRSGKGQRILMVDDEEPILHATSEMLRQNGYQVEGFSDPRQALDFLHSGKAKFDLFFIDSTMPGMTGTEFVRAARQRWPEVPVILSSGSQPETAEPAEASLLLEKPYSFRQLAEVIHQTLNGSK